MTVTVGGDAAFMYNVQPGQTIQDAIDNAIPGDLIMVPPGTYEEQVILWKPVQLQGWGAYSTTINAVNVPFEKRQAWRDHVRGLVLAESIDLLPSQEQGFALPEPDTLFTEEGAGIIVLAQEPGPVPTPSRPIPTPASTASVSPAPTTAAGSSSTATPAGWRSATTRCSPTPALYAGGIRVGHPFLTLDNLAYDNGRNNDVDIHHNQVIENGGLGGFGGGVSINNGANRYDVTHNWICGNFTQGEGGGIAHYGRSNNGLIGDNTIIFNQVFNQGLTKSGGGVFIGGAAPLGAVGRVCDFNDADQVCTADADCPGMDVCGLDEFLHPVRQRLRRRPRLRGRQHLPPGTAGHASLAQPRIGHGDARTPT